MKWHLLLAAAPVAALVSPAYATDYLTIAQAQAQMLPGAQLRPVALTLDDHLRDALQERSGVHEAFDPSRIWRCLLYTSPSPRDS